MINELYQLSLAMDKAGVQAQNWHRKYKPIPNIRPGAPCIRIVISGGEMTALSNISPELGACLRKYGSNQGSYPCMNLAPLYRVTDEGIKRQLSLLRPEELDDAKLAEIRSWCGADNWCGKFRGKYKISMVNTPAELREAAARYEPLRLLIEESSAFADAAVLRQRLEAAVWGMLERRENVALALCILFHHGKAGKKASEDYGSLSVALEAQRLIDMGCSAVSAAFVAGVNQALLDASQAEEKRGSAGERDAFGFLFEPLEEPMPSVKLAGCIDVTLRTMFRAQHCQTRYGVIENASYPISPQMRKKLQAALAWLGDAERKDKTWTNIDKNEILFAHPARLPEGQISFTRMFRCPPGEKEALFTAQAKQFIDELTQGKTPGTDSQAERIQLFILRKVDKARTKVIYTRQTNAKELEKCAEGWTRGCTNLPRFRFGQPKVPFPMEAAAILNRFWTQAGNVMADKLNLVPQYHGMELLMEPGMDTGADLRLLVQKEMTLGPFLNYNLLQYKLDELTMYRLKELLALTGLLLERNGIRKERYMENLPYQFGQLLKACDELHVLYCKVVREGDVPPQLVGVGLFRAASEMPLRTLNLLSQRMMPYYGWAKSYGNQRSKNGEIGHGYAKSLYRFCEKIAVKLGEGWTSQMRFNAEEKAQLFLGYLAEFSKKEMQEADERMDTVEEEEKNG